MLEAQDKMMKNSTQSLDPSSDFYTLVCIIIIAEYVKIKVSGPQVETLFSKFEI